MSKVNMIIEEFYEKAAKSILSDSVNGLPEDTAQNKKIKLDVLVEKNYKHINIQKEFLKMLDNIDIEVFGTVDESNSYVKYYKGYKLLDESIDVTEIIGKVIKKNGGSITGKSVITEIKKELLEKNSYMRIAELYYYKKNDKWYEQEVEEAFREVVDDTIGKRDKDTVMFSVNIEDVIKEKTQNHVDKLIDDIYEKVYLNENLKEKYRITIDEFKKRCEQTVFNYIYDNVAAKHPKPTNNSIFGKYAVIINTRIRSNQYYTLPECYAEYKMQIETPIIKNKSSYERFYKCTVTALAGFNYAELADELEFKNHFILNTMVKELNIIIKYLSEKMGKVKYLIDVKDVIMKEGDNTGTFRKLDIKDIKKYINSIEDINRIDRLITLYMQIIIAVNPGEKIEKIKRLRI